MNIFILALSLSVAFAAGPTVSADVSRLETALKKRPQDTVTREKLGGIYSKRKKFDDVIRVLSPYSNEISINGIQTLAEAYRQKKDFQKEVLTLSIYIEREPDKFRPNYLIGRALKDAGKTDEAVKHLRSSISMAPKHQPSFDELLKIFVETKQNYESRILLNDMIKTFGEKKGFLNQLCALYINDGFLAEARSTCQKAIKRDPRYPDNHVHLAQSFLGMENKKSSEKVFIVAARQFPKSEYVQWATGEFYYQDKNYPIAIRYLRQAVLADPKSARSNLGLAISLFETNAFKDALPYYLQACKQDESRVALEAFRSAAGKLRHKNSSESGPYESELSKCER